MIVSNDSIMKPPYDITNKILKLLTSISEKLGEVNAIHLDKPSPELRKRNRIKTIHASLEIEGNTLTEEYGFDKQHSPSLHHYLLLAIGELPSP